MRMLCIHVFMNGRFMYLRIHEWTIYVFAYGENAHVMYSHIHEWMVYVFRCLEMHILCIQAFMNAHLMYSQAHAPCTCIDMFTNPEMYVLYIREYMNTHLYIDIFMV